MVVGLEESNEYTYVIVPYYFHFDGRIVVLVVVFFSPRPWWGRLNSFARLFCCFILSVRL